MANIKEKVKNYWEEHKTDIIFYGSVTVLTVEAIIVAYRSYKKGFMDGAVTGTYVLMDWLEKTFPGESNAKELFERYMREHPDEVVNYKF